MSSSYQRQTAVRAFAQEFNDATYSFKESDSDMAPKYALLPTGQRMNRGFFVGTLTETEDVGNDAPYWHGRVVDATGVFHVYAGQYQPEAEQMLREVETPAFVSVVGKPRTYETDSGNMNVAIRPESITEVDVDVKTNWVVETAARTLDRIEDIEEWNIDGLDDASDAPRDVDMALEEYDMTFDQYREMVHEAVESVKADIPESE